MTLTGGNDFPSIDNMDIDNVTLADLSFFSHEDGNSVYGKLDLTRTVQGREQLKRILRNPQTSIEKIKDIQSAVRMVGDIELPQQISNGTLMVIEQFYETAVSTIPRDAGEFSAISYKLLRSPDFSLIKYSTGHCTDLIEGMYKITAMFSGRELPQVLNEVVRAVNEILANPGCKKILALKKANRQSASALLQTAHFLRYKFKRSMIDLIQAFAKLDAWHSMASAAAKLQLHFPVFKESDTPLIDAKGLYHILLPDPVPYDIQLWKESHFLFLTSANMAGKSTFIKSIGIAVYLAHTGMAVPAAQMTLSLFDGMLSNINVTDNILKGESYFYNEVRRISDTVKRINDGRRWLILIDELFKGTNVQDAMKCSITVIEGLIKVHSSIFILSTHLYEIADSLKHHPGIMFRYFETTIEDEAPVFHYNLKEGISNDRLGYLILKQSGVVEMLREL